MHQVLLRDESVLRQIAQAPGDTRLVDNEFVFSLRGLHRMLDPQQHVPFKDFRKLLYDSTLNHELGLLGAEVATYDSTGKTDSSLYCLRPRQPFNFTC